jgi:hypothetical protein
MRIGITPGPVHGAPGLRTSGGRGGGDGVGVAVGGGVGVNGGDGDTVTPAVATGPRATDRTSEAGAGGGEADVSRL